MMPDWLQYDPKSEVITVDGIKFAREVFSNLAKWDIGQRFELLGRDDGVITVRRLSPVEAAE